MDHKKLRNTQLPQVAPVRIAQKDLRVDLLDLATVQPPQRTQKTALASLLNEIKNAGLY